MNNDSFTLYKLIVLYMLSNVDFPLTRSQIVDFILEKEYTSYLNLQAAISQLCEGNLITQQSVRNRTQLFLTDEGRSTIAFFQNRISPRIKEDINQYFKEHSLLLKEEVMTTADYHRSADGGYRAQLVAKENNIPLVELSLFVPTEQIASSICQNWEEKNQMIYQYLVEQLF